MAKDFTVDRASSKWVLGDSGALVEYAADEPAIEFNADGSYKGVLVEPASTNESLQSEDLDNATYWTVFNTTIAGDTETDPKGGTNSFLLAETITNAGHSIFNDSDYRPTITSGETWTQSVYLKKGSGANAPNIMQLTFSSLTHSATQYANFNISTGTILTTVGGTATIQEIGNGWYRCSWTSTATSTGGGIVGIVFTNNDDSLGRLPAYAGQTNADVFVWGAQLEESPIATSYIPTTTGSVTRVKDDIYITGASSLIGQSEGTLFVEVDWRSDDASHNIFDINDGTFENRVMIYNNNGDTLTMYIRAGGNPAVLGQGVSSTSFTGIQKIAFTYEVSATAICKLFRNGSSVSTSASIDTSALTGLNEILMGRSPTGSSVTEANMHIRTLALYKTKLSDAECEALTTL